MKNTLLGFLLLLMFQTVSAQNNLQFNSVKFVTLSCPSNGCLLDTTITIPPGRTWKIESAGGEGGSLKLNNRKIYGHENRPYYFPIWLPEGTHTFLAYSSSAYDHPILFISVIEFNLVP